MKINFKSAILILSLVIAMMVYTFSTMENHWDKQDLANVIGNFESSDLIDENGNAQIWRVSQYGKTYIVKVEDGHLLSKTEL